MLNGDWIQFDDAFIIRQIRKLYESDNADSNTKLKAKSILGRTPPKLVGEIEYIVEHNESTLRKFLLERQIINERKRSWAERFGIDKCLWYIWEKSGVTLTKSGSRIPISSVVDGALVDKDKHEQSVRVLDRERGSSSLLMEIPHSLMSILSNYALYSLRVYVLFPDGNETIRDDISRYIKNDLPSAGWK